MSDEVTPAVQEDEKPLVVPAAAPSAPAAETVTLPKEEADQLRRDAARTAAAQRETDRLRGIVSGNKPLFGGTPPAAPSAEEVNARAVEEDRKAEVGLKNLVLDPKYREVLDADPTLREMFVRNPLGVIPVLADEPFDAQDAIEQVKTKLDDRIAALKKGEDKPAEPVAPTVAAPAPGAVVVPADPILDEQYEAAKKEPNIESALHGMIGIGLKRMTGKNGS